MATLLSKKLGNTKITGDIVPQYVQLSSIAFNKVISSFGAALPTEKISRIMTLPIEEVTRILTPTSERVEIKPTAGMIFRGFPKVYSDGACAATIEELNKNK